MSGQRASLLQELWNYGLFYCLPGTCYIQASPFQLLSSEQKAQFLSFFNQLELLYSVVFFGHLLFCSCYILLCLRFRWTWDSCGLCTIQFHPASYTKNVSYPLFHLDFKPYKYIYCQTFVGHSHLHGPWNARNSGRPRIVVSKSWILISCFPTILFMSSCSKFPYFAFLRGARHFYGFIIKV